MIANLFKFWPDTATISDQISSTHINNYQELRQSSLRLFLRKLHMLQTSSLLILVLLIFVFKGILATAVLSGLDVPSPEELAEHEERPPADYEDGVDNISFPPLGRCNCCQSWTQVMRWITYLPRRGIP